MGHIESKIKNLKGILRSFSPIFTGTFVIDYLGTKRDIIHNIFFTIAVSTYYRISYLIRRILSLSS